MNVKDKAYRAEKEWLLSDDVCQCGYAHGYIKGYSDRINVDAKWIRENVGADVAVDFLKAMEG